MVVKRIFTNRNDEKYANILLEYINSHNIIHHYSIFIDFKKKLFWNTKKKNFYLGVAAHDIRTPMTSIFGYAELIQNTKNITDEKKNNYSNNIIKACNNALSLSNNILDFARSESGEIKLVKTNIDYIDFVSEIIKINEIIAKNKNISIKLEINEKNIKLFGDEILITQTINNLISNAIKYSKLDSIIIIKIYTNDEKIVTEIIDTGVGINPADIKKIMNPFVKGTNVPTGKEKSYGLGLAISKKIIEMHYGSINIDSEVNAGTKVSFMLPMIWRRLS